MTQSAQQNPKRYNAVAVILHWLMAIGFIGMLASGLIMSQDGLLEKSVKFQVYQLHKSFGVLLLIAVLARIGWRLCHKVPPLPDFIHGIEKLAVKLGHLALYALMFLMPFTGWLMVSSSPSGLPTMVFGIVEWPHIPGLTGNRDVGGLAHEGHEILGYIFIAVILVHVAAVFKHIIIDKYNFLPRMWFGCLTILCAFMMSAQPVNAANYEIDYTQSILAFAGEHAGNPFTGVFEDWLAEVNFDSENLTESSITAVIQTKSATTGDKMYDKTLPTKDWFDVKTYPEATFVSQSITKTGQDDVFHVLGLLTIKGEVQPVEFDFSVVENSAQLTESKAEFTIDRMAYNLGTDSDPDAEWVGKGITIQLLIVATKQ